MTHHSLQCRAAGGTDEENPGKQKRKGKTPSAVSAEAGNNNRTESMDRILQDLPNSTHLAAQPHETRPETSPPNTFETGPKNELLNIRHETMV